MTLASAVTTPTIGGLVGGTNLNSLIVSGYGNVTALTLNPAAGSTDSYSGAIADGAGGMTLTKAGAGTQILSANTYSGSTTISGGSLVLGGGGSLGRVARTPGTSPSAAAPPC